MKLSIKSIDHLKIKIDDSPFENISQHFSTCIDFISKNIKYGNVFVHCVAGVSRSATIVIAYVMRLKKYGLKNVNNII